MVLSVVSLPASAEEKVGHVYVVNYTKGENWQDGEGLIKQPGLKRTRTILAIRSSVPGGTCQVESLDLLAPIVLKASEP